MFHFGILQIIALFVCIPLTKGFIIVSQHHDHYSFVIIQARNHPSFVATTSRCPNADLYMNQFSYQTQRYHSKRNDEENNEMNKSNWSLSSLRFNPFKEFIDMFSNWDDVVDDFLFKRMGNGEVFYGKRKYKPSGRPNTEGKYGGMGRTDIVRIQLAQEIKEKRKERSVRDNKKQQ